MVHKRQFEAEELHEVTSKLPRQEHSDQLALCSRIDSFEGTPLVPAVTGETAFMARKIELGEELGRQEKHPLSNEEDLDSTFPGCHSISSWGTSSTSEEDVWSEAPFYPSFFPEFFYPQGPVRTLSRYEDVYSLLLENPAQKPVPIGPDHQAEIPTLREWAFDNISDSVPSANAIRDENLGGSCILPMPNFIPFMGNNDKVGNGRINCSCADRDSIRCVRQHVVEARDKLKNVLGPETFAELGFSDMGEQVAEKWAEEEERMFHEIVSSNPASVGKNFWNILSSTFPSRTKGEIVSYYFNVFMLRKRAEQNRCDPLNIDSDNDEWQPNEEYDSVVESPAYGVDPVDGSQSDHSDEFADDDVAEETCECVDGNGNLEGCKSMADVSQECLGKTDFEANPECQLEEKNWDDGCQGVQDDSCTSFDTVAVMPGTHMKDDVGDCCTITFDRLNSATSRDQRGTGPCNVKVWNAGYVACPNREVDFLPTFSMIEEAFRDECSNKPDRKDSC